jgi:hypothetical protein
VIVGTWLRRRSGSASGRRRNSTRPRAGPSKARSVSRLIFPDSFYASHWRAKRSCEPGSQMAIIYPFAILFHHRSPCFLSIALDDSLRLFEMSFGLGSGDTFGGSWSRFAVNIDVMWLHSSPQRQARIILALQQHHNSVDISSTATASSFFF